MIAILSLLDDADVSAAENVSAGVRMRKELEKYKKAVMEHMVTSEHDIPAGSKISRLVKTKVLEKEEVDDGLWCEFEADSNHGDTIEDEGMVFGMISFRTQSTVSIYQSCWNLVDASSWLQKKGSGNLQRSTAPCSSAQEA